MEDLKQIPNCPDYYASPEGKIYSKKSGSFREMSGHINRHGYKNLTLSIGGKAKFYSFHQLIAMAFLDFTPNGHDITVDHIDGDKLNNNLHNLQILSSRENLVKYFTSSRAEKLPTGVTRRNRKFRSIINMDCETYHLGYFDTPEKASEEYQLALYNWENHNVKPLKRNKNRY